MNGNRIKRVEIHNLWNRYHLCWEPLHPDVNILVGINGSGKSTLLAILAALLAGDRNKLEKYGRDFSVELVFDTWSDNAWKGDNHTLSYHANPDRKEGINLFKPPHGALLSTFDAPILDKQRLKAEESSLDQQLDFLIYQREKGNPINFTNYRLKATMPHYNAQHIADAIGHFFTEINSLFQGTGKTIAIDAATNDVIFRQGSHILGLTDLSSGEKQLLIILFRLFLMEKNGYVILMDEPELSLHIEWQQQLIDKMLQVNPNGQFIIATHSPSIFGKGWMNRLVRMENLKE